MANGISVSLPLTYSKQDGPFLLNKTIQDAVKQNFKNLVLTAQGERLMDPNFGIGLYSFLFENYTLATNQAILQVATEQVRKYMPFINIEELTIADSKTNINQFYIYIRYSIQSLNVLDELTFTISR